MHKKRPFSVTLLLWMVLSLSAWGAIRFFAALRWWNILHEFDASLSPFYLSITGAGWVVVGGVLIYGIWSVRPWTRPAIFASILIWLLEYWIERVFFQPPRANLPFALSSSILILAITWIMIRQRGAKFFFTRSEEHEQSDKTPYPE